MAETTERVNVTPSDRNPSLNALAESEARFRKLVEALPDAILVHCEDKIVFVNPFCVRLLAAQGPEQLLGKDISRIVHSDYLPEIKDRIRDCYATGAASLPAESILIACDGAFVEIESVAIPITWNGLPAIEVVARDIRTRKRAEQEVYEWRKRLELAQKAGLRIGLWDWDVIANSVIWSDETYRQFGFARDTFSGRVEDAVARIHPEDRARVEEAIRKVLAGGEEYAAQYRIMRPDGSTCWIDAHGVMVRNGSTHMLGIGIDITDLKKTELLLQDREEKYLLLLNSTAEAIYGLDLEGRCTFCNPACVRLLGHEAPENLLGRNMHALMHHTQVDGTPYPVEECEIYVAVREGRASHVTDEVLWRRDGTSFLAEYWSYPMYKAGGLVGAVVTFLDISDRKRAELALHQSEEKYRKLFENATYGIFLSKPDGTLLDVNPALVTMLGYNSREELLRRNLSRDIYEDPAARASILDRYEPSGRVDGADAKWKRKDAKIIDVRVSGGAVRGEDGSLSHFEVIVEDITKRRSLEEQFRQAQKMEAVGLLSGGIAHDFNNLLSVIIGHSEILEERLEKTSNLCKSVEEIKKAGQRAASLTRQLLAFSRQQVLAPKVLDLNTVVADTEKMLRRLISESIELTTVLDPELGHVRADQGQIEQVIMNLAVNARDAMPEGGKILIETRNANLDEQYARHHPPTVPGNYVMLVMTDTGIGMDEQTRSHIFEPFFTTKELGKGTGLGLSTVYGIVKQSGGYIWVDSEPRLGSTFKIYLPQVGESAPRSRPSDAATGSLQGSETILIIEDEESVRALTRTILEKGGYTVLEASSGSQAIDIARQYPGPIHLLLTDLVMPGMNGQAVAKNLMPIRPEMRVIYTSGYTGFATRHEIDAEAIILPKPVTRDALLRKVHEVLNLQMEATGNWII